MDKKKVFEALKNLCIEFEEYLHPAVFTCEEADRYTKNVPGMPAKTLFLKSAKSKNFFLAILPCEQKLNFTFLQKLLGEKKLTFARTDELRELLDLTPGAVTPFGVIAHPKGIDVYIDERIVSEEYVQFHPGVNTATIALQTRDFKTFLDKYAKIWKIINFSQ